MTLHRPSNVDDAAALEGWSEASRTSAGRSRSSSRFTRELSARLGAVGHRSAARDSHVRAAAVSDVPRFDGEGEAGPHGFGRDSGGDHRPSCAVPDPADEYRASGDPRPSERIVSSAPIRQDIRRSVDRILAGRLAAGGHRPAVGRPRQRAYRGHRRLRESRDPAWTIDPFQPERRTMKAVPFFRPDVSQAEIDEVVVGAAIRVADDRAAREAVRGGIRGGRRREARHRGQLGHGGAAPGRRGARPRGRRGGARARR